MTAATKATSLRGSTERRDKVLAERCAAAGHTFVRLEKIDNWGYDKKAAYHLCFSSPTERPESDDDTEPRVYETLFRDFDLLEANTANPYQLASILYRERRSIQERLLRLETARNAEKQAHDEYGRLAADRAAAILGGYHRSQDLPRSQATRALRERQGEAFKALRERIGETRAIEARIIAIIGEQPA